MPRTSQKSADSKTVFADSKTISKAPSAAEETAEKPHYLGHRQRLRERFLKDEGRSMPDYELLELLLTAGILRRDVKEMSKRLLVRFETLAKVVNARVEDLAEFGVPQSAIAYLKLVPAIARKTLWQGLRENDTPVFSNFDMMLDYCKSAISHLPVEEFHVIFLDAGLRVLKDKTMQTGTVSSVSVYPREVVREALLCGATSVVLMHNHPSGRCEPSRNDCAITRNLEAALSPLEISVEDHLILTSDNYYSFRAQGLIKPR